MWTIYKEDKKLKTYPFKLQAAIYCYIHGYVYEGTDEWTGKYHKILDPKIKIVKENC